MCAATGTETALSRPRTQATVARMPRRRRTVTGAAPYLLIAPAVLILAAIMGYPLVSLLALSMQHYGLRQLIAHQGVWVGLDNYSLIVRDGFFWKVMARTVVFVVANVGLTILLGTVVALLLERVVRPLRLLLMTALILIWGTPQLVAVSMWQWMFDYEFGLVNWLLTHLQLGNWIHHNWFQNPIQGFTVITVIVVWGAIPFVAITLYAGLMQVPREQIEAAKVDGARPRQVFWGVTMPVLMPLYLILGSLSTIWDLQVFNQIWFMRSQRPGEEYFLIGIYTFAESFRISQYGLGSALAVVMVLALLLLTFFYVRRMVRMGEVR